LTEVCVHAELVVTGDPVAIQTFELIVTAIVVAFEDTYTLAIAPLLLKRFDHVDPLFELTATV
jgi:hypothetical protein